MLKHSFELRDYKGQKLCESCWNGRHFGSDHLGRRINTCDGGKCECPCSAMEPDWSEHNRSVKRVLASLKASQTSIGDVGTIEIK